LEAGERAGKRYQNADEAEVKDTQRTEKMNIQVRTQMVSDDDGAIATDTLTTKVITERVDRGSDSERNKAVACSSIPLNRSQDRRHNQTSRSSGALPVEWYCGSLSGHVRKLLLLLLGHTGTTVVSTAALWVTLLIAGNPGPHLYALLALLVLIRAVYSIIRDPRQILSSLWIRKRIRSVVSDEIQIGIVLIAAAYVLEWPFSRTTAGIFLLGNLILQLGTLFFTRPILRILARDAATHRNQPGERQVIIVGTGKRARSVADAILDSPELETSIKGFLDYSKNGLWRYRDIPLMGHPDLLRQVAATEQIDTVVIAVDTEDLPHTRQIFNTAEKMGVAVCFMPNIYRPHLATTRPTWVNGTPALVYRTIPDGRPSQLVKSIIDKVGALVGLIVAGPLMLLSALAIKFDGPGPVLFKQKRCGLNGKRFSLYKFRTMRCDAEREKHRLKSLNVMSGPVFKARNDPRVTRVGRILRRCSIDEIPQFFNVLRGEMSLVGPRPPLPKEVAQYEPWQHRRLSVKPGVTCLWQVNGRNNIDFEQWMHLDLQYIDNWSLWLDTKILARTLPAVIKGTGAS
jgi:exopolysaccharide biosynthesis polyprenyl glycosylphosphotransferase